MCCCCFVGIAVKLKGEIFPHPSIQCDPRSDRPSTHESSRNHQTNRGPKASKSTSISTKGTNRLTLLYSWYKSLKFNRFIVEWDAWALLVLVVNIDGELVIGAQMV